jgi:hypothetical protein
VRYTIESRQLSSESSGLAHHPGLDFETKRTFVDAISHDDAIDEFVRVGDLELVNLTRPLRGQESIATVKKDDAVYLVRIYEE